MAKGQREKRTNQRFPNYLNKFREFRCQLSLLLIFTNLFINPRLLILYFIFYR